MEQLYSEKELRAMTPFKLRDIARKANIDDVSSMKKDVLIEELLKAMNTSEIKTDKKEDSQVKESSKKTQKQTKSKKNSKKEETIQVESQEETQTEESQEEKEQAQEEILEEKSGVLDINSGDSYGFLRAENCQYGLKDAYVSARVIKQYGLRVGDYIVGNAKKNNDNKPSAIVSVISINGIKVENFPKRSNFDTLVPIYPKDRLTLETNNKNEFTVRCIDLIAPIGKGQRAMIVSPPKAGKTTLLKKIANAIADNHPDVELYVLLIDERPEEVTDMQRSIRGEVVYSTFDETPEHHCKAAELLIERAKRNVELGKDVVVIMDSLTRLARAYNLTIPPTGRTLSGGMDPGALHPPKKFFGSARNIEGGGSLTIIATALVETGSRMDDVIYEEFKGTGNMEIHLDRKLSERRIFPALDLNKSSTRREDLLLSQKELEAVFAVRKLLSMGDSIDTTTQLMNMLMKTNNNKEFVDVVCAKFKLFEKQGFSIVQKDNI